MAYDWDRIEHEYVTGKGTMEALARKYGIKLSSFYRRAEVRKFAEKREKYTNSVREKALTRAREREIRTLTNLGSALDKAAKKLNNYIADEDTLHGRVAVTLDGVQEYRTKKLDTKAVRDLTAAMKEVAAALKLITPDETRTEETQAGVIILAQREDEES